MHPLARTTPLSRAEIVALAAGGTPVAELARRFAVSRQTIYKWLRRFRENGALGLRDGASIALSFPTRVSPRVERSIARLRRNKGLLGWQIAVALDLPRSTIIKVLKRLGMARLKDLEPPRLFQRYVYEKPGQLVHIDIKKLGRFSKTGHRIHGDFTKRSRGLGYDFIFVAVDDCSRSARVRSYANEDAINAADFLRRVILDYQRRGVTIERIMTDNGKVFTSFAFQNVLQEFGIRHILTPIYTPRWNGKAERFIQSMLREWAYAIAYRSSQERLLALPAWMRYYNQDRLHTALNYLTPAATWRAARKQPS
jgi:transposase InsO family protein